MALLLFLAREQARLLYAHVTGHNAVSLCVLENCGFRVTGEEVRWPILTLEA